MANTALICALAVLGWSMNIGVALAANLPPDQIIFDDKSKVLFVAKTSIKKSSRVFVPKPNMTIEDIRKWAANPDMNGEKYEFEFPAYSVYLIEKSGEAGAERSEKPQKLWEKCLESPGLPRANSFVSIRAAISENKIILAYVGFDGFVTVDIVHRKEKGLESSVESFKIFEQNEAIGPSLRDQRLLATSQGIFLLLETSLDVVQLWEIKHPKPVVVWSKLKNDK